MVPENEIDEKLFDKKTDLVAAQSSIVSFPKTDDLN